MAIQTPPATAPAVAIAKRLTQAGADCVESPAVTAASPPITKAPSFPTVMIPARAGRAVHNPQSIRGAARSRLFCHEYQLPNPALYIEAKTPQKGAPQRTQNPPNSAIEIRKAAAGIARDSKDLREGTMAVRFIGL